MQYMGKYGTKQVSHNGRVVVFLAVGGALLVFGLLALMVAPLPAPQNPIEKTLDAKAFLENK